MSLNNTYLTNTTELTAVADAIRAKAGTVSALEYPNEFVSTISAITTGGSTISAGLVFSDYVPKSINNMSIEFPTKLTIKVPDGNKFGDWQGVASASGATSGYDLTKYIDTISIETASGTITTIPENAFNCFGDCPTFPQSVLDTVTLIKNYGFNAFGSQNNNTNPPTRFWDLSLPVIQELGYQAFANAPTLRSVTIGTYGQNHLQTISSRAFNGNGFGNLKTINILETPSVSIFSDAFRSQTHSDLVINVVWSQNEVSGAPWGATNATINYDYNPEL